MAAQPRQVPTAEWISIGRASHLLGVNPATLRQWATAGKVHAYRTPGGHRRFSARELAAIADASGEPARALAQDLIAQLQRRYRELSHSTLARQPWMVEIDGPARAEFHELGDALLAKLAEYITVPASRRVPAALQAGHAIAAQYGRLCRRAGLDTTQAIEAYVLFRQPLLDVLGRAVAAHPAMANQLSRIMRMAERFMDEVLAGIAAGAAPNAPRERGSESARRTPQAGKGL